MAPPAVPDFLDLIAADPARLESVAFECLINRLADARVASVMHVLGWPDDAPCFAVAGRPPRSVAAAATLERLRGAARDLGGTLAIAGIHDGVAAIVVAMQAAATGEVACTTMAAAFADDSPIALGPVRHGVGGAVATLHAALHTMTAAPALAVGVPAAVTSSPTVIRADDALPERALLGDADARRELVDVVYASLTESGPDDPTLGTVSTFLFSGGSLEITAKTLGVHPNTVRYRLKRAADTTGWDATDPREAYVLRTAIALGRMTVA
ncbi:PucR family transcriptional regulator [Bifidobacterium samirii]|uniref:PucR family transcriptional regulator n=1 Tax=Bifidobacterium samirii TaxID=2306974 RepID=UPI003B96B2AD